LALTAGPRRSGCPAPRGASILRCAPCPQGQPSQQHTLPILLLDLPTSHIPPVVDFRPRQLSPKPLATSRSGQCYRDVQSRAVHAAISFSFVGVRAAPGSWRTAGILYCPIVWRMRCVRRLHEGVAGPFLAFCPGRPAGVGANLILCYRNRGLGGSASSRCSAGWCRQGSGLRVKCSVGVASERGYVARRVAAREQRGRTLQTAHARESWGSGRRAPRSAGRAVVRRSRRARRFANACAPVAPRLRALHVDGCPVRREPAPEQVRSRHGRAARSRGASCVSRSSSASTTSSNMRPSPPTSSRAVSSR
jgi:hypothetical protein